MRKLLFGLAAGVQCLVAVAGTDTALLLYTTDFHDHIRPGPTGRGGVPSVATYVKQVRARRSDVILVDAGDVVNKGDWVGYATRGKVMYEAMGRIGYTAAAPGNHDFVYGFEQLLRNAERAAFPVLCANLSTKPASPWPHPPSVLVDVDGLKVGIIGFTLPGAQFAAAGCRALSVGETGKQLAAEAVRLDREAQLIVAVGHCPAQVCKQLAAAAPAIDVFVAGHSHAALPKPQRINATGAFVVQAGCNAAFVGRLELTVDLDTEEIVAHEGELVALDHQRYPPDRAMTDWLAGVEKARCPKASEILAEAGEAISGRELGRLYAAAIRLKAGADIALMNPRRLLGGFAAGQRLDRNAVFASHMMDGRRLVRARMSGAALQRCLAKARSLRDCPCWDGFTAQLNFSEPAGRRVTASDLVASRDYSVVMPADMVGAWGDAKAPSTPCDFDAVAALEQHLEELGRRGVQVRRPQ